MPDASLPDARPADIAPHAIWIFHRLGYGYLGLDVDGGLVAFFPVEGRLPLIGRTAGALRIEYRPSVHIEIDGRSISANCCSVTIADRTLDRSFWALANALAREFADAAAITVSDVSRALSRWEQLFQRRRRLSMDEEQGLWGELCFLARCGQLDSAIRCWRGPNAEDYDFLANGIALEVKTSRRLRRHRVSHEQVVQATEPGRVFLVSIWAGVDPIRGTTLPQMIELVAEGASDPIAFETQLLETGYSHSDRRLYDRPFALLDDVMFFDMVGVPRVRGMDPGVTGLSYVVDLSAATGLSSEQQRELLQVAFS